jgi:hypothetical protein
MPQTMAVPLEASGAGRAVRPIFIFCKKGQAMLLVSAVYFSRVVDLEDPDEFRSRVDSIMSACGRNNPKLGLTGALICERGSFLQILEGSRAAVSAMLARIMRDPRHTGIVLADFQEIAERAYSHWSMSYIDANTAPAELGHFPDLEVAPAEALRARIDAVLASPVRVRVAAA